MNKVLNHHQNFLIYKHLKIKETQSNKVVKSFIILHSNNFPTDKPLLLNYFRRKIYDKYFITFISLNIENLVLLISLYRLYILYVNRKLYLYM